MILVFPIWNVFHSTRANSVTALKTMVEIHNQLNLPSGMLIMNPIPKVDSIPVEMIEPIIDAAVKKAKALKISGKDITPFLLSEVTKATSGLSQHANISLIKNNVRLGAELAFALAMDA